MQTFAERLISLREDEGWKKKELAEKLHVSDSMISQYESGRCMPSYDVIITIARLFHVSVDYLLCGSAEAFPFFHTVWKQMPTDIRLLLERKYILGQADAEIAADLGIRPESVRMRLTRAKRIAAKELLKNGFITGIDEF